MSAAFPDRVPGFRKFLAPLVHRFWTILLIVTLGTLAVFAHAQMQVPGAQVNAGQQICVVESVKAASDIYAPVSGTVIAVNDALTANPALLNTDPFGDGWIFKIRIEAGEDIEHLKSAAQYREQIGGADAGGEV